MPPSRQRRRFAESSRGEEGAADDASQLHGLLSQSIRRLNDADDDLPTDDVSVNVRPAADGASTIESNASATALLSDLGSDPLLCTQGSFEDTLREAAASLGTVTEHTTSPIHRVLSIDDEGNPSSNTGAAALAADPSRDEDVPPELVPSSSSPVPPQEGRPRSFSRRRFADRGPATEDVPSPSHLEDADANTSPLSRDRPFPAAEHSPVGDGELQAPSVATARPTRKLSFSRRESPSVAALCVDLEFPPESELDLSASAVSSSSRTARRTISSGTRASHRQRPAPSAGYDSMEFSATGNESLSAPVPEVNIPSEMKCPVCLDAFQAPVTLSCNHNVCREHVLDLACGEEGFAGPSKPFRVRCPKCRHATEFPKGEASVKVNFEMKAVVDMMLQMLTRNVLAQSAEEKEATRTSPRGGGGAEADDNGLRRTESRSALRTPSRGRSDSRGRRVHFADTNEESARSANDATPTGSAMHTPRSTGATPQGTPHKKSPGGNSEKGDTDKGPSPQAARHREHISRAKDELRSLEQQLEDRRDRLRKERQEAADRKAQEYKKARQEEIERRQALLLLELAAEEKLAQQEGVSEAPTQASPPFPPPTSRAPPQPSSSPLAHGDALWSAAEQQLEDIKRRRAEQRERELEQRERALRDEITHWNARQPILDPEKGDIAKQLRALNQYTQNDATSSGSGPEGTPRAPLTVSVKARQAEERIQHLYEARPKTAGDASDPSSSGTALTVSGRVKGDLPFARRFYDEEVERKMWEVTRDFHREQEEELTRAQKAEIAEQRARALIQSFTAKNTRPPMKPTYVPKLHRLQQL